MKLFCKTSFYCLAALAAGLTITPLATGIWLKNNYQSILNEASTLSNASITLVHFKRGWFHSSAEIKISDNALELTLDQRIQHGPILFERTKHSLNPLTTGLALIHSTNSSKATALSTDLLIHSSNHISAFVRLPELNTASDKPKLSASNIRADIDYRLNAHALTGSLHIDTLQSTQTQPITASQLTTHVSLKRKNKLWYGERQTTIGDLQLTTQNKKQAELVNTTLIASSAEKNNATSITIKGHSDKIKLDQFSFEPMEFNLSIDQLNTPALSALANAINKIDQPFSLSNQQILGELYPSFLRLIGKGASITLHDARFKSPEGNFHAEGTLSLPNQHGIPNWIILSEKTKGSAQVQVSRDWLKLALNYYYQEYKKKPASTTIDSKQLANQTLHQWIDNKTLIPINDTMLGLSIDYQKGQLKWNSEKSTEAHHIKTTEQTDAS